jgi:hypothetical protein
MPNHREIFTFHVCICFYLSSSDIFDWFLLTDYSEWHHTTPTLHSVLSFSFWPFLPMHCKLLHPITLNDTHSPQSRTPLDEWSARRTDFYLTTHNTHNRRTSIPPAGFEPAFPANERSQTDILDGAANGIDCTSYALSKFHKVLSSWSLVSKKRESGESWGQVKGFPLVLLYHRHGSSPWWL